MAVYGQVGRGCGLLTVIVDVVLMSSGQGGATNLPPICQAVASMKRLGPNTRLRSCHRNH